MLLIACAALQLLACKPPVFTSADTATFTEGTLGIHVFTTTGSPAPKLSLNGSLPAGVAFAASTGMLYGTPAEGTSGAYPLTVTAGTGSRGSATQNFTLNVVAEKAPVFTSANNAVFTVGSAGSHTFAATGSPAPTFSLTGALPPGMTFDASSGKLSGTPAAGSDSTYPLTVTADNGKSATQDFTLAVVEASTAALIVQDGVTGDLEERVVTNVSAQLTAAGFTVSTNVGVPAGPLAEYAQIWDVRYTSATPLSLDDIINYSAYLAGGRKLIVIGENTPFAPARDISVIDFISIVGGGTITLSSAYNAQIVQPPFDSPNPVTTVSLRAGAGTDNPGRGAFITKGTGDIGMGIYYPRGSLSSAPCGLLLVFFDVNFMEPVPPSNDDAQSLLKNMIAFP